MAPSVTGVQVGTTQLFPGTTNSFFLAGAGVRSGLDIEGKFVKFEAIGVYNAESLAVKRKGKTAEQLTESEDFFRDVVTGSFKKLMQATMILVGKHGVSPEARQSLAGGVAGLVGDVGKFVCDVVSETGNFASELGNNAPNLLDEIIVGES